MSKIIVVEGADRSGKATQSLLLKQALERHGKSVVVVEVPIRSAITYRIIYWMLQNGLAKKFPKSFQWLQFINRKIFQMFTLPGLERTYGVIIMDRWSLSTIIYGSAEGLSEKFTDGLTKYLRKSDHTIILLGASFPHKFEDVYEADQVLQEHVRIGYAAWAAKNKDISTLIDCNDDKQAISKRIQSVLTEKNII